MFLRLHWGLMYAPPAIWYLPYLPADAAYTSLLHLWCLLHMQACRRAEDMSVLYRATEPERAPESAAQV